MAKKRTVQIEAEIRDALSKVPKKPGLKTRAELDDEIDAVLAQGLPAERYEVARALGFVYPRKAPPKTMKLTGVNIFALTQMVIDHGPVFPGRVDAVHAPHIKRTIALGLVEPSGSMLRLTQAGRELVTREIEKDLARESRHEPRVESYVRADLRDDVLARERAKHQDKIDRLQSTLAKLR